MNVLAMNRKCFGGGMLIAMVIAAGCASHRSNSNITAPVQPNPQPRILTSSIERIYEANLRLVKFGNRARQLPGDSEDAYRVMMRDAFTDLAAIIPALAGPDFGPAFRQQIRIVESTSGELAALPAPLSSEAPIAAGLRAAYNALVEIHTEQFSNRSEILDAVNSLHAQLDLLDTMHGSAYRDVVAHAVQAMGSVMEKMNHTLMYRLKRSTLTADQNFPADQTQPSGAQPSGAK